VYIDSDVSIFAHSLLSTRFMKRVLTGIQSTGVPHLGNVLGAMLPAIEKSNQPDIEAFLFIADLHSLTTIRQPEILRQNTLGVAAAWLALGFDIEKNVFYRQSDVTEVTELTWYLNCLAPYPMLANAHSFKDRQSRLAEVNGGLFTYPVLMAADILLYGAHEVPVGKDQKQHLEMTRDMAGAFNRHYGENILVVPEAVISDEVKIVPGTDGQKMSKSYNNYLSIFAPEKEFKKQVMGIVTDSKQLEDPKDPDSCNVFKLYELVASADQIATMRSNYIQGGYGYGHAKKELLTVLLTRFEKPRTLYDELMRHPDDIVEKLHVGAAKAKVQARITLDKVRSALGFR
jgi:tryptophanyl-tRNA synthetase